MIKKIILWTVYVLIVGLLVFGAANRTSAKTDQEILFGNLNEVIDGRGRGISSPGTSDGYDENEAIGHVEILKENEWAELIGSIIEFDSKILIIRPDSGGELELSGRAWRYILETGYIPALGSEVWLSGFYENGEYKIASFQDLSSRQVVTVRDISGLPLWR